MRWWEPGADLRLELSPARRCSRPIWRRLCWAEYSGVKRCTPILLHHMHNASTFVSSTALLEPDSAIQSTYEIHTYPFVIKTYDSCAQVPSLTKSNGNLQLLLRVLKRILNSYDYILYKNT